MRICENGVMRDMTAEEVAAIPTNEIVPPQTEADRISALETLVLELGGII